MKSYELQHGQLLVQFSSVQSSPVHSTKSTPMYSTCRNTQHLTQAVATVITMTATATPLVHCSLLFVFSPRTAAVHFNFPACVNNLNNSMSSPTGIRQKELQSGRGKCSVIICYLDSRPDLAYYLRLPSQHLYSFLCSFLYFLFAPRVSSSNQIFLLVK